MDTEPHLPGGAAWVPWSRDHVESQSSREAACGAWLIDVAKSSGWPVVVQGTAHPEDLRRSEGVIGHLAEMGTVATYRSPAHGATYVKHASIKLLATGMSNADGYSIVATEVPTFPLDGWAMAVGAVNIDTGLRTADERSDEQREHLNSLAWSLYNGWSHPEVGRRATSRLMPLLAESGMSYSTFVGSMIALRPRRLTRRDDINEMHRALPTEWERQRHDLARVWTNGGTA